jgi:hypothetical protein
MVDKPLEPQPKLTLPALGKGWRDGLLKIIRSPLFIILAISGVVRLIYYSVLLNTVAPDTAGYLNYSANILCGQTEGRRTPVYPYFIKLIGLLGRQNLIDHVVIAQMILSFLAIILFYRIVKNVFKSPGIVVATSLLYGVMLPLINFDKLILTESLSVNCCLLFVFMLMSYLQRPTGWKAWLLTLYVFIAIMLRPSFIYLLPFVMVFWILRLTIFKRDWKMRLSGLAASMVVVFLILGYSQLNKRNANFNGISTVSNDNQMTEVINAGIYQHGNDPELSAALQYNINLQKQNNGKPTPGINIAKRFEPDRVHRFIVACIKNMPSVYSWYICGKLTNLSAINIFTNYASHKNSLLAFRVENVEHIAFCVTFYLLYIFIALSLVSIIYICVKTKQMPWFRLVLWLIVVLQLAVAILGGYSEYPRLILPAMPALIILLFSYIDQLWLAIDWSKIKRCLVQ